MMEIVEDLRILTKTSNTTAKLLTAYLKLKEHPVDFVYLMEKKHAAIIKMLNAMPQCSIRMALEAWLDKEKNELEKAKDEFRFNFGEKLKLQFSSDNWQLRGQYPLLRVGLYTLKLDFEFGEASLFFGPEVEKIKAKIPLEAAAIYKAVKRFDDELKAIKFEPHEFYQALFTAYKKRLVLSNKSLGEKLLLTDVLGEYVISRQPAYFYLDPRKENFRAVSRIQLTYLVYLLNKTPVSDSAVRLHVATLDATTDRKQSIWVPGNEEGEGTYYSHISFEKN